MKKYIISVSILAVMLVSGNIFYSSSKPIVNNHDLPVVEAHASYVHDNDNIKERVGIADYVFVGEFTEEIGIDYNRHKKDRDGNPYTKYSVKVLKNIKGNLKENIEIEIDKKGGMNREKDSISLFKNDSLPKVGKYYIVLAYAQSDGSLLISGSKSNVPLKTKKIEDIISSKEYKQHIDAYKNQIVSKFAGKLKSKHDKEYKLK